MTSEDCEHIELPAWRDTSLTGGSPRDTSEAEDKPALIASLLLAKLGDFLVPGMPRFDIKWRTRDILT